MISYSRHTAMFASTAQSMAATAITPRQLYTSSARDLKVGAKWIQCPHQEL